LKNTSRTVKINLTQPKGFVIIDNNAGFITLNYDLNGSKVTDTIPVDSIVNYSLKQDSNDVEIIKKVKVNDATTRDESILLTAALIPGETDKYKSGKKLYKSIDSAINI